MNLRVILVSQWRNLRIRALSQIVQSRHELVGIFVRQEHRGVPLPDLWMRIFARLPHGRAIARRIFNAVQAERAALWRAAYLHKIKIYECTDINNKRNLEIIKGLTPDIILTMAWPKKFGTELLKLPRLGCINCHPSLLPKHRGCIPIPAALLAGDKETGLTFHYMNEDYDAGDVLLQKEITVEPRENTVTLFRKCGRVALNSLIELLDGIAEGHLVPKPQNTQKCLERLTLRHLDGLIDWEMTSKQIDCKVRALYPSIKPYTFHGDQRIEFSACEPQIGIDKGIPGQILGCNGEDILIATVDAAILIKSPTVIGLDKRHSLQYLKSQIKSGILGKQITKC